MQVPVCGPYYSLTFFFALEMQCVTQKKRQLLNPCLHCLTSFHSIFLFRTDKMLSLPCHRSGKSKRPFSKHVIFYVVLSFQQEPLLYPNIVWLNRQHSCFIFWKSQVHILAQRQDIPTDGLIVFLSSSRHMPGQFFTLKPLPLRFMCF